MNQIVQTNPISGVDNLLLADIAIKLQLSPSLRKIANERYNTIAAWIDRDGSPLRNRVSLLYPQGSMAIRATIASKLSNDEFDLDIVSEITGTELMTPTNVLDILFEAIQGDKASRYHGKAVRNSRCVTVQYANMHLDITPSYRLQRRPERTSKIYHSKVSNGAVVEEYDLFANPFGFAQWFNEKLPEDFDFSREYASRSKSMLLAEAPSIDVPDQDPQLTKSKRLVSLQLLKRWRNVKYDNFAGRKPPSVVLSCLVANAPVASHTLLDELKLQVQFIIKSVSSFHESRQLLTIRNPTCEADVFTDRWPANLNQQEDFLTKLKSLHMSLESLQGASLVEKQRVLSDLFGEKPTSVVFEKFARQVGKASDTRELRTTTKTGGVSLTSSGLATSAIAGATDRGSPVQSKKHTFYGDQ